MSIDYPDCTPVSEQLTELEAKAEAWRAMCRAHGWRAAIRKAHAAGRVGLHEVRSAERRWERARRRWERA